MALSFLYLADHVVALILSLVHAGEDVMAAPAACGPSDYSARATTA